MRVYSYDLSSGHIIDGGYYQPSYDPSTQGLLTLDDDETPHPDRRTKRVTDGVLRDATVEEIAAYDAAKFTADVAAAVGQNPLVAAVGLTLETRRIGREMTPEEQQSLLGEVALRYQALRGSQG